MNQRLYRVFHLAEALITGFASTVCGFFGYIAIKPVVLEDNPDEIPILILGLILTGVSAFQLFVFLFTVFGRYRISVDDRHLSVEIGIGLFSKTHDFAIPTIDAILVADNGRGRPAIGILADRAFRFGQFLPEQTIFDAVDWLQISTGKNDQCPTIECS
jgi:hypothetical protein